MIPWMMNQSARDSLGESTINVLEKHDAGKRALRRTVFFLTLCRNSYQWNVREFHGTDAVPNAAVVDGYSWQLLLVWFN